MDRNTVLVREYANRQDFTLDEQKLGQQGWSVQSNVSQHEKQSMVMRLRSFFTRTTVEPAVVVTYHRPNPS